MKHSTEALFTNRLPAQDSFGCGVCRAHGCEAAPRYVWVVFTLFGYPPIGMHVTSSFRPAQQRTTDKIVGCTGSKGRNTSSDRAAGVFRKSRQIPYNCLFSLLSLSLHLDPLRALPPASASLRCSGFVWLAAASRDYPPKRGSAS